MVNYAFAVTIGAFAGVLIYILGNYPPGGFRGRMA